MTKKEFAVRLLFWLFPWPISRALPRSLRIYYFGPTAGPPPGFYDYYGIPLNFWPDAPPYEDVIDDPPSEEPPWWPPDIPPYEEFIEDPPEDEPPWWDPSWPPYDEFIEDPPDKPPPWWPPVTPPYEEFIEDPPEDEPPWWPTDPYNPPPVDEWPPVPPGPSPDPWPPSPFPGNGGPHPQPLPIPYFDDIYWHAHGGLAWNDVLKVWAGNGIDAALHVEGTWNLGLRASYLYFEWSGVDLLWIHLNDTDDNIIATLDAPGNKVYIPITFVGYDIGGIYLDGDTIQIRDIQFV